MRSRAFFVLLLLFVTVARSAQTRPTSRPTDFRVSLSANKNEYMLGETVILTFTVENTGMENFGVEFGGDTRGTSRAVNFWVSAVDAMGVEMPDPEPEQMSFGGFSFPSTLTPGQKRGEPLSLLHYRRITAAGLYRITVSHPCGWPGAREDRPSATTEILFRMPSDAEAEQLVASMIERAGRPAAPGKPREFVDFTTLQHPIFLQPLLPLARAGNAGAIYGIASIATRDATVALLDLAQRKETKDGALLGRLIQRRLPRLIFPNGKPPQPSFPAEVWDENLRDQTVRVGLRLLAAENSSESGAGAAILSHVARDADARLLLEALNTAIAQVGEARPASTGTGNYPGAIPNLLGMFAGMRTRGWAISLAQTTDSASIVAFLDGYRMKPLPRPDGFEKFAVECLTNKSAIVREAALWSFPRPLSPELKETVMPLLSDPDTGVQRAARFAADKREHLTPDQIAAERARILETFKNDPQRLGEEMHRFSQRVLEAITNIPNSQK